MSEKRLESIIRDFVEAYMNRDVEKTLSFLSEDVVWTAPEGTFRGKDEAKRLITWSAQSNRQIKFRDAGIGIMVKGGKAVYEYVLEGVTQEGMKYETPGICAYEFSGEKIQQHMVIFDRLSIAKQAAKGTVEKRVINGVLSRVEKGLR